MAANDVNISDLTFEGIKTSLVNYLKTQDTFKDYNFEGSGIKTLVDLMAYNTFYYGYYANMMANEMFLDSAKLANSMISLTKPLGYLVPGALSAKSTVRLRNINFVTQLSPFSVFRGRDVSGRPYFFYNLDPIDVIGEGGAGSQYQTDYFDVYEGKSVVFRQLVNVDVNEQTITLTDVNIDPRTIRIEVKYNSEGSLVSWQSYLLNPETIITSNTEIFFLERTKTGYKVNFGKYSFSDTGSAGKQIGQLDQVYISYLVSSGSPANNISNFRFVGDSIPSNNIARTSTTLEVYTSSLGGSSQPNLDEIRFFAPKTFARQNRVVTKNDYIALMNELGYQSNGNPDLKYKIFGGEEASPPAYGRVFVSIMNLSSQTETQRNEINQVLSTLKEKSVISILPEYIAPMEVRSSITASFAVRDSNVEAIRQAALASVRFNLFQEYGTKKFNTDINKADILNIIRNSYRGIQVLPQEVKVTFQTDVQSATSIGSVGRRISLKNKLSSVSITGINSTFTAKTDSTTGKYLYLYSGDTQQDLPPIGEVYFDEGIIIIYPQITSNALTISFEIPDDIFFAKDQLVCYVNSPDNDINLTIRS